MFEVTTRYPKYHRYGSYQTAWEALEGAMDVLERKSHATQLTWCGTNHEFYEEVTGAAPTVDLTDETWIIGDDDFFTVVERNATADEIKLALQDITRDIEIEEVE